MGPIRFKPAPGPGAAGRSLHWVGQGAWAVIDQGLFAGANFLLNVLLTRWLSPAEYGAFAVGFSVLSFLGAIHIALLSEPMLVFGPGRYKGEAGRYVAATIYGHFIVAGAAMLAMVATGVIFRGTGRAELATGLIGLGLGCPCILLLWMMRRACYMLLTPRRAAAAGAGYLALMGGGLVLIQRSGTLSLGSAIALLDGCNLVAATALAVALRPRFASAGGEFFRHVAGEHWRFGRWGIGSGTLYFASGQLFFITVAAFRGLDASAALRAMSNLIAPATLITFAWASLLAPVMVTAREQGQLARLVGRALAGLVASATAYWMLVGGAAPTLFRLLYRGHYLADAHLLRLLGASVVATAAIDVLGAALRALEAPRDVFVAFAVSAAFALTAGTALTWAWGLAGAVAGIVASGAVTAALLACLFYRRATAPAAAAGSAGGRTSTP